MVGITEFYSNVCCPTRCLKVTSPYGQRLHPVDKVRKLHTGIDYGGGSAFKNFPLPSYTDGVVVYRGYSSGYGNRVFVQMPSGNQIFYAHLHSFNVKVGDKVKQGDIIGGMGTTGKSTGVHVHIEIRKPPRKGASNPTQSDTWGDPEKYDFSKEVSDVSCQCRKTVTVKAGDTLHKISVKAGCTVAELRKWNNRTPDQDRSLQIGTVLFVEPGIEDYKADIEKLKRDHKNEVAALEANITALGKELDKRNELVDRIQHEKVQLEKTVEGLITDCRVAEDERDFLLTELEALKISHKATCDKMATLETKFDAIVKENKDLNARLKAKTEKLAEYDRLLILDISWKKVVAMVKVLIKNIFERSM